MRLWVRRVLLVLLAVGLAGLAAYAFRPQPVGVDLAAVRRGLLRVTVDEDGKTRLKNRYVVSSPLDGELQRVPWKAGDAFVVAEGHTAAVLLPRPPSLLDPRERETAEARAAAAAAAREQAAANLKKAQLAQEYARAELTRGRAGGRGLSPQDLENLELKQRAAAETEKAARHALDVAEYEQQVARVALKYHRPRSPGEPNGGPGGEPGNGANGGPILPEIRIPFPIERGRILRVWQESRAAVTPGLKLLEVGDPADLECEIDVLSADAVRIPPRADVLLEHWGGEKPLTGQVRLVEPAGFTKISALGVEEQRVWVIIDFLDPPAARRTLGDGYRVEARIVIWEGQDVLKVPASALFRHGDGWAVYAAVHGRAEVRPVQVGRSNGLEAQVLDGLADGDEVVVHPGDKVRDGVAIVPR